MILLQLVKGSAHGNKTNIALRCSIKLEDEDNGF